MNENKFTGKARFYAKYRPSYPTLLADRLYRLTKAENVADIGAGTGIFTEKLLAYPWTVTAVEPNHDMCRELLKSVGGKAEIVMASAENTGLPEHSFDLITAAQAFHWFDADLFREECKRLLTENGRVAIIYNSRIRTAVTIDRDAVFMKYCTEFAQRKNKNHAEEDEFLMNEYFSSVDLFQCETPVMMTWEHFIGDALSRSHSPMNNDPCFKAFVAELREVFDKHQKYGKVSVSYNSTCYTGKF